METLWLLSSHGRRFVPKWRAVTGAGGIGVTMSGYAPFACLTMPLLFRLPVSMTSALVLAALMAGCATPATSDDAAVTLETSAPVAPDSLRARALAACQAQGKQQARFESQMNADARLPAGQGVQLNTFICR